MNVDHNPIDSIHNRTAAPQHWAALINSSTSQSSGGCDGRSTATAVGEDRERRPADHRWPRVFPGL